MERPRCFRHGVVAKFRWTRCGSLATFFSRQIEQAGADALELNLYSLPTDLDRSAEDVEEGYLTIVAAVKGQLKIPVSVKLSPFFTT